MQMPVDEFFPSLILPPVRPHWDLQSFKSNLCICLPYETLSSLKSRLYYTPSRMAMHGPGSRAEDIHEKMKEWSGCHHTPGGSSPPPLKGGFGKWHRRFPSRVFVQKPQGENSNSGSIASHLHGLGQVSCLLPESQLLLLFFQIIVKNQMKSWTWEWLENVKTSIEM